MGAKKKKKTSAKAPDRNTREIAGVCLIAGSLFLCVCTFYADAGLVGTTIGKVSFALFGLLGYAMPVFLFLAGLLMIIFSENPRKRSLPYLYILMSLCVLTILHTYAKPDIANVKVLDYWKDAWRYAMESRKGGGLLGALLAYPSLLLLGEVGTYIFFFAAVIVLLLLITRVSLRQAGERVGQSIKSGMETVRDHREKQRENRKNEQLDPYADDLFSELMETAPEAPRRRRSGRKEKPSFDLDFDLSAEAKQSESPKPARAERVERAPFALDLRAVPPVSDEDIPIRDLHKARYADLDILPASGPIERAPVSRVEQDIDDVITAIAGPETPILPPPEDARASRISENAPRTAQARQEQPAQLEEPAIVQTPVLQPPVLPEPEKMQVSNEALPYQFPPVSLLKRPARSRVGVAESPEALGKLLIDTLASFNISARLLDISVGPVITRYELQPAQGVRVSRITTLSNDIALALAAPRVRIEAPIPGKAAVGIEIPNKNVSGVSLREIIEADEFKNAASPIAFALGKDIAGKVMCADLAKMPHLLIAGSTGSGKSVCINDIITSMVYRASPSDVRMILIDPKVVELKVFSALPHLYLPVVTDPKKAAGALKWAVMEMEQRYKKMSQCNARDVSRYNTIQTDEAERMPLLVIIIDELADLMMVAAKDVEESICRIAQLGRACGIHLIVATQRPSADIITGLIKANIPSRIAFMVSSAVDSRVIMDCNGAEKLLGRGDMLFHPNGAGKPVRVQGAFISDEEVEKVTEFFTANSTAPQFKEDPYVDVIASETAQGNGKQEDELLGDAVKIVLESGQASISMIQRRLRVGYARAARLIDIMEQHHIVSGFDGSKPRKLLITSYAEYEAMLSAGEDNA